MQTPPHNQNRGAHSPHALNSTLPEEQLSEEKPLEELPAEETPLDQERSSVKVGLLIVCALIALHCWIRFPAVYLDYFHNEDTAGITYSADLLARGGAPLIDTVEMKAPGSFFLLAGWWALVGRSLMSAQLLGALWSGLAALGVMFGAWVLYRSRRASCLAGLLYIYLAPFTDSIDINYGAWMITPYVWASVALFMTSGLSIASRGVFKLSYSLDHVRHDVNERVTPALFKWLIVGALIALAALMKRQGAAIFPLALLLAYRSAARWRASLSLICGTSCVFSASSHCISRAVRGWKR